MAHFDLKLYQIVVKIIILNKDLKEEIYMTMLKGLHAEGEGNIVYKLERTIYILKQTSRQWYLKFNDTIIPFGFK